MKHSPHRSLFILLSVLWVVGVGVGVGVGSSFEASAGPRPVAIRAWLRDQEAQSIERMLANISPAGTTPGVVVASPERISPPYYFHWVRDAALTMRTVVTLSETASNTEHARLEKIIFDYVQFSRSNQLAATLTGLGEPKFNIDGSAYQLGWCRPQNDGPALRAMTLSRFAFDLLASGREATVRERLYDGAMPTSTVIKADLEFVSNHWRDDGCDIWEETRGQHFYTRLVQWRALSTGAELARRLGDAGAAAWYDQQAGLVRATFKDFFDTSRGIYYPTIGGVAGRPSGIDTQVLLGLLHSEALSFLDAGLRSTVENQLSAFKNLYSINSRADLGSGIAVGRYPEDIYDGGANSSGHPWFLSTAAIANLMYRAALEEAANGHQLEALKFVERGDLQLDRIRHHAGADGALSEQFNRFSGYMLSARDLTWSHVEFIEASRARARALEIIEK